VEILLQHFSLESVLDFVNARDDVRYMSRPEAPDTYAQEEGPVTEMPPASAPTMRAAVAYVDEAA